MCTVKLLSVWGCLSLGFDFMLVLGDNIIKWNVKMSSFISVFYSQIVFSKEIAIPLCFKMIIGFVCLFSTFGFVSFVFFLIKKFQENFHETGKIPEITFKCELLFLFMFFYKKKLGGVIF